MRVPMDQRAMTEAHDVSRSEKEDGIDGWGCGGEPARAEMD